MNFLIEWTIHFWFLIALVHGYRWIGFHTPDAQPGNVQGLLRIGGRILLVIVFALALTLSKR